MIESFTNRLGLIKLGVTQKINKHCCTWTLRKGEDLQPLTTLFKQSICLIIYLIDNQPFRSKLAYNSMNQ